VLLFKDYSDAYLEDLVIIYSLAPEIGVMSDKIIAVVRGLHPLIVMTSYLKHRTTLRLFWWATTGLCRGPPYEILQNSSVCSLEASPDGEGELDGMWLGIDCKTVRTKNLSGSSTGTARSLSGRRLDVVIRWEREFEGFV
jgi:hypothetical protein